MLVPRRLDAHNRLGELGEPNEAGYPAILCPALAFRLVACCFCSSCHENEPFFFFYRCRCRCRHRQVADVAHPMKPWDLHERWTKLITGGRN